MKTLLSVLLGAFCVAGFGLGDVSGQVPKVVNGGIVNGKAISLPKPAYPDAAKAAGVSGMIAVDIVIDEEGNVASAEADPYDQRPRLDADGKLDRVEADLSLREAAEAAAREAKFSPTRLSGEPVRVKGRLIYNFVGSSGEARPDLTPRTWGGGVLNGKAVSLPKPEYPAAAKAVGAQGAVSVQMLIDEEGNVERAEAVSGHPLLRASAEAAAREAKFSPTYQSGQAVKVSGVLTYNFALPKRQP